MLYTVVLTYKVAPEEIKAHLDTHRDWLVEHTNAGRIIAAGPMESATGGVVLALCNDRAALDAMLATDSFYVHQLVSYEVFAFTPALCAAAFAKEWAPAAKAI